MNHSHRIVCVPFLHRTGYRVNLSQIHNDRVQTDHFSDRHIWIHVFFIQLMDPHFLKSKNMFDIIFCLTQHFVGPIIVFRPKYTTFVWDLIFVGTKNLLGTNKKLFWSTTFLDQYILDQPFFGLNILGP